MGKSYKGEGQTLRYVSVLINVPIQTMDNYYTYHAGEELENELAFGKPVIGGWGPKKVEGNLINDNTLPPEIDTKANLSVLDREAVLGPELYQLARWLAESCMCPMNVAINAMIPRKLSKK